MFSSQYMTNRVINACLRENVSGIQLCATPLPVNEALCRYDVKPIDGLIDADTIIVLEITHLNTHFLLPVTQHHVMQPYIAISDYWYQQKGTHMVKRSGYAAWLSLLSENLVEDDKVYFDQYTEEVREAISQGQQYYEPYKALLLNDGRLTKSRGVHSLLDSDHVAAFTDHPYYPSARAKFGMTDDDIRLYTPEFRRTFSLYWAVVNREDYSQTDGLPKYWPAASDVGIGKLSDAQILIPVHPMMLKALEQVDEITIAPKAYLDVIPTLSVRAVTPVDDPRMHLKLPLPIATLGRLNVRYMEPATLPDGALFAEILSTIFAKDEQFKGLVDVCDESDYGYFRGRNDLSYLVRTYPAMSQDAQVLSVASFFTIMSDGRFYIEHAIDNQYQGDLKAWFSDTVSLVCLVHLRLWLVYGIALECNQQNTMFSIGENMLSVLFKDNDGPAVDPYTLCKKMPEFGPAQSLIDQVKDKRCFTSTDDCLINMFVPMIFHLTLFPIIENLFEATDKPWAYSSLKNEILNQLAQLETEGIEVVDARQRLIDAPLHPIKYLLTAASLYRKQSTGALDANKFYGQTAPNPLFSL